MKRNSKQTKIYYQNPQLISGPTFHKGGDVGVLLIHGFTATNFEVSKLADHFISKGYTVSTPLLPGHGASPSQLNKVKYPEWLFCVEDALISLNQQCNKIIVGGESMGAVLSLYLAEQNQAIHGLLLFSTALLVRRLRYARLIKYFQPIKDKNLPEDGIDWQGYNVYPMFAADQFYKLTRIVKHNLYKVNSPTLLFQGQFDKSIDEENIDYVYYNINSGFKRKVSLNNSGHVMLLDKELDKIITNVDRFILENQIF